MFHTNPIDHLGSGTYFIRSRVASYAAGTGDIDAKAEEKEVIDYLTGRNPDLHLMALNEKNARAYLELVKIADQVLGGFADSRKKETAARSYALRTRILELCSPEMKTCQAYAKTLNGKEYNNRDYLQDPFYWVNPRKSLHGKALLHFIASLKQSGSTLSEGRLYVVRGNTAAGKSTYLKGIQPCVDLDEIKAFLIKSTSASVTNTQVHDEGASILNRIKKKIRKQGIGRLAYEGRFSTIEELEKDVFKPAKKWKLKVSLIDLHVPLQASLTRVLARDLHGKEACPSTEGIVQAYRDSIKYREKLIELAKTEACVETFRLLAKNDEGSMQPVCKKEDGQWQNISSALYRQSMQPPQNSEIAHTLETIIDESFIKKAIERQDIHTSQRDCLKKWEGVRLGEAVDLHSAGLSGLCETYDREKYGAANPEPFTGWWLEDYPHMLEHIKAEQILHLMGTDDSGRGLHWHSKKFQWGFEARFNPDARVGNAEQGGCEICLGYFIIPAENIRIHQANPSAAILEEFIVRDFEQKIIGYRFFIHPACYKAYDALLMRQSFPFVTSEKSEFIGAPTSSYRSWVIRRIEKHGSERSICAESQPFIIKLSMVGSLWNKDSMFTRRQVDDCMQMQSKIDEWEKQYSGEGASFSFFPERLGISLRHIVSYVIEDYADAGLIIREFPPEYLAGNYQIISLASLISVERSRKENNNVGLPTQNANAKSLPLIYGLIEKALEKGLAGNTADFIQKYFIEGFFKAASPYIFDEMLSMPFHGQNLCLKVSRDGMLLGYLYRDLEGIKYFENYLETYHWFYKHNIVTKLLNVLTNHKEDLIAPIKDAPLLLGQRKPLKERNLFSYLKEQAQADGRPEALNTLHRLGLQPEDYNRILASLDAEYRSYLAQYYRIEKINFALFSNYEVGSSSHSLAFHEELWKVRYDHKYELKGDEVIETIYRMNPNRFFLSEWEKDPFWRKQGSPWQKKALRVASTRKRTLAEVQAEARSHERLSVMLKAVCGEQKTFYTGSSLFKN